jgi:hypothetical protein
MSLKASYDLETTSLDCMIACITLNIIIYLTLRLDSSLNNPQNNEMKFSENRKLTC